MEWLERARALAIGRHAMTRYDGLPYETHLAEVERVLSDFGFDTDQWRVAAWTHDMIEDTGTTRGELELWHGKWVADIVWAVTGVGANRRARLDSILGKLIIFPDAAPLKCADRIANVEYTAGLEQRGNDKARMYLGEADVYEAVLSLGVSQPQIPMYERLDRGYDALRAKLFKAGR